MRRTFLPLFLATLAQPTTAQTREAVDTLGDTFAKSEFVGAGIAAIRDDRVHVCRGLGKADVAGAAAYTATTTQTLGSVSKLFVGVALIKAIEERLLSLDTEIEDVLPFSVANPHCPDAAIRVEHLATHTSGIRDDESRFWKHCYFFSKQASAGEAREHLERQHHATVGSPPDLAEFIRDYFEKGGRLYGKSNFLDAKPGERYEYSNVAVSLLAYVIEVKARMPFHEFCDKRVFAPLDMKSTQWQRSPTLPKAGARLFFDPVTPFPPYALASYPDGGLRSSAEDLAKFVLEVLRAHRGKSKFLSKKLCDLMLEKRLPAKLPGLPERTNSGVLWDWMRSGRVGHNGADPGLFTMLTIDLDAGSGSVMLLNQEVVNCADRRKRIRAMRALHRAVRKLEAAGDK